MNPKKKNIAAFKALVLRYETITLKEIRAIRKLCMRYDLARNCTGWGRTNTCTLCTSINKSDFEYGLHCQKCVYGCNRGCMEGDNEATTKLINNADTPKQLFKAYRARGKHLRRTYPQYLTE